MSERRAIRVTQADGQAPAGPGAATVGLRADERRSRILRALHECVIERGYAKTTLADVARGAAMSPSHLLYYFQGTDAILAHYFAIVCRRISGRLEDFRGEEPERQIRLLAELFFAGRAVKKSEIGFMLECFGVAVHDRRLRSEKTAIDRFCKEYLQQLFERSPCGPAQAKTSAEVAYALLVGLRTAAYFDARVGPRHARRLFHESMLRLAQLRPKA